MDHHETAAADIAGARIGHRQRERRRHRGIDRVAAFLQDVGADARGDRLLGHHHAVGRCRRTRMPDLRIKPAFGTDDIMASEILAREVVSKAVRQEGKRDNAGECKTAGGSERIFLHGAD